ncbi:hypothetical protein LBGG_02344 [Lactobacillus gasseri MV-22]|nr:hypothetical protein LBGG_02344 [Lactobacillus gasseri MV-22]
MDNRQQIHLENLSLRYRGIETSALKHIRLTPNLGMLLASLVIIMQVKHRYVGY